jgi:hypothetical protein
MDYQRSQVLLTVREIAVRLQVRESWVYRHAQSLGYSDSANICDSLGLRSSNVCRNNKPNLAVREIANRHERFAGPTSLLDLMPLTQHAKIFRAK